MEILSIFSRIECNYLTGLQGGAINRPPLDIVLLSDDDLFDLQGSNFASE